MKDNNYPYEAGDIYPREGLEVSEERLSELASDKNLRKEPLIKKVEEKKAEARKVVKLVKQVSNYEKAVK